MLRGWRRGTLAVIGLLLCFFALQLSFFFTGREVLKLREQTLNILSPGIGSGLLPLNVSYQLLMGSAPSQQRFLVVGLSSVRRKKEMYLKSTLQSIFSQSSEEERAQMVVVVLLADFDWSWRQLVTEELQTSFYKELRQGQLLLIHVPQEQYPPLTGLKRNYNDAADRVSFRSKQNVDYSFLIHFCSSLGQFYLQLEDDVYCAKHFLSNIRQHIKEQNAKKTNWAMLEFSNLGFIGKLYKSTDLPILAQFLFLFYQEMPCDWLMSRFQGPPYGGGVRGSPGGGGAEVRPVAEVRPLGEGAEV
uniref:MGAT4 conserved region domain-containing protein n=1 Tax=Knipowitschia caucasica TaxID=637954 RepID=A0AAV2M0V8_KNICA